MKNLKGKKVLLIAPRFFGYEIEICNEIERRGAQVDWLADRPFDWAWQLMVLRVFPQLMLAIVNLYYERKLKKIPISDYDIIFAVNTITLTPKVMKKIKELNSRARYVIYTWDSMENREHVKNILQFFTSKWCFDPDTSTKYGMNLRPLFYLNEYTLENQKDEIYDLSFIGSVHTDRYEIVGKIKRIFPKNLNFFHFLYLRADWFFWVLKVIKPSMWQARYSEFEFQSIPKKRVIEIFHQSKVILDIEHLNQRGLTMRTFEALGAKKKLITTNANIRNYDFFKEENICVIDRNFPEIPASFWDGSYQPLLPEIYHKYSLAGWLDEVLSLQICDDGSKS